MATLFRGGRVLDGTGAGPRDADVLVREGAIAAVGANLRVDDVADVAAGGADEALAVEEVAGCTIVPGLIDCHTHITKGNAVGEANAWQDADTLPTEREAGFLAGLDGGVQDALAGARFAARTLAAGFTTVRDVGGGRRYSDIALREAVARGFVAGPRILASGGGIAMTGGHAWGMGFAEADGADEVRRVTRQQLKAGADVIKLVASRAGGTAVAQGAPELSVEEMRAACTEAHLQGRRVCAHAIDAQSIKNAVEAGVDTIEHGCLADEEALEMMAARGRYLICTLLPYYNQAHLARTHGYPDDVAAPSLTLMERYPEVVKEALSRGVPVALGSDCGIWELTPHGSNATELQMLVDLCEVTPARAIELATAAGAQALGLEDVTGVIEVGKAADLLVVAGDPTADITLLCRPEHIRAVVARGVVHAT